MSHFQFFQPVEIRYGDLDPQGHVNNAVYLTYLEQARIGYIRHLGIWRGGSWLDIGIILADAHLTFHQPIVFEHQLKIGVRTLRLGNKSMTLEYSLVDGASDHVLATAETVLVTYDYRSGASIPIPANWRAAINTFEQLETDEAKP